MDRSGKEIFVQNFSESFENHECMIVVQHSGLNAGELSGLRQDVHAQGVTFQVVKNSLVRRVLQDQFPDVSERIRGPVGVFFSQNPVAAAKIVSSFSKKKKERFLPLVGVLSKKTIQADAVESLASLPDMDQMRAILLRTLLAPATALVRTIAEPSAAMARVVSSYNQSRN